MRFRLLPSGDHFFGLFTEASQNAADCARQVEILVSDISTSEKQFLVVKEHEKRGDSLTEEILRKLDASFITPFDREDIHQLTEHLDDVVDDMYGLTDLLNLMRPNPMLPEMIDLSKLLTQMTDCMNQIVMNLQSPKKANGNLEKIGELERQGDDIYRRTMARLFTGDFGALEVLKWKDTIQAMEQCLNQVEDASDVLESIILKQA